MLNSAVSTDSPVAKCQNYTQFCKNFSIQGDSLYDLIFERNQQYINIKKRHVATANLKKLFAATFKISAKIGFHEMTLRDLSRETGISMGSIYACIGKKENLAIIVKDIVNTLSQYTIKQAQSEALAPERLERNIRLQFYTSCLLQPWFSFLFMETRCLPESLQADSKQIELDNIANLEQLIANAGTQARTNDRRPSAQGHFLASNILVLLQDWYLKPWKHRYQPKDIEDYLGQILAMTRSLIDPQTPPLPTRP